MNSTVQTFVKSNELLDAIKKRRTIYALNKDVKIEKDKITATIEEAVQYTPAAFNSPSARAVILFGEESNKLWGEGGIAEQAIRKVLPEGQSFEPTAQKLASFNAGIGTILYFKDIDVVKGLQEKFALYADNFPFWAEQTNGMTQLAVWTALANIGIGASLQHYNPLIDEAVHKTYAIPENWVLRAQMPFGNIAAPAGPKEFQLISDRVKVLG